MSTKKIIGGIAGFVVVILMLSGFYQVEQYEQGIILQLGKYVKTIQNDPGVHWKKPFLQSWVPYDARLLEWDGPPEQTPTSDNKLILIDSFARWKISDPAQFYRTFKTESAAQGRLNEIIKGAVKDVVTSHVLAEVVRTSDRHMVLHSEETTDATMVESDAQLQIEGAREEIREAIMIAAQEKISENNFGIELVMYEIKRTQYVAEVQQALFNRMISEQKRIAQKYTSEGAGKQKEIYGQITEKEKEIMSDAYLQSKTIRGEADATAVQIYADAYGKDEDFYWFLKSLEVYEKILPGKKFILSSDHPLLEVFGK